MPNLYIISGCNGSGKTTASYSLLPGMLGCGEFVNSDEFAKSLSPFNPSAASVGASRYMLVKIKYMLTNNRDFCIETTLATRSLVNTILEARSKGYEITILYFWLNSPELAIKRVQMRVEKGGHNIPEDVVRRRYYMGLNYFFEKYMPLSDHWMLLDNSKIPFGTVAIGDHHCTEIKDKGKYEYIWSMAHPAEVEEDDI